MTGLVFIAGAAAAAQAATRDRVLDALLGAGFIAYGIYVARQVTGTYLFPVWIFIVPFIGAATIGLRSGWSVLRVGHG